MFKTVGIVSAVVIALAAMLGGFYLYFRTDAVQLASDLTHVRSAPYFVASEHALSLDPPLNALLGGNMKFGEVVIKQNALTDNVGAVQLDMVVSGTNGSGHARVKVTHAKQDAPWQFQGGDFFPDSGRPLHLDAR